MLKNALRRNRSGIVALTAYDYPTARILDGCGLDLILVGDSVGMVVSGRPDTTEVTLGEMVYHTRAVARGVERTPIVSDLPFGSYGEITTALKSAEALLEAGARGVKLEGGSGLEPVIRALVAAGIQVVGHVGMLPQKIRIEGGYRIKGKTAEEAERLREDARSVERSGALAVVLELVSPPLAAEISEELSIPTIGIGSGDGCDGQIRVFHDIAGFSPWFRPKFAVAEVDGAGMIEDAAKAFARRVRAATTAQSMKGEHEKTA